MRINNKGFSLVELMVVVAIIAILASFAVPQYETFQSKARQKEGLTLLNGYYAATKATEAESGIAHGNFEAIGYNPAGQVHYRIVAANGTAPTTGPTNATCITTAGATVCTAGYQDWNEVTTGSFAANAANNCTAAINSANGTFNVCASSNIRANSGADVDTWMMTERKVISVRNDGLN